MGRTARSRGSGDHGLRPVTKVELSGKNIKLRIVVVIIALIVGAFFIALGVRSCISAKKGWQTISASSMTDSVAADFTFMYNVGQNGMDATVELRALTTIYTDAAAKAYRMFSVYAEGGGLYNVNKNIGTAVEVSAELYAALEKMTGDASRILYRAPYFEMYEQLFSCDFDYEAREYDPNKSDDTASYLKKLSSYVNDPAAVSLELLSNNTVRLNVSEEYAAFASENDIDAIIGFSWLESAFSADYIAQKIREGGFDYGYIVGIDGAYVNLDNSGNSYTYSFYGGRGNDAYVLCRIGFTSALSGFMMRGFELDGDIYSYVYENGETVTRYIDENGYSVAPTDAMLVYSYNGSCADAALFASGAYISDNIESVYVSSGSKDGLYTVYHDGGIIYENDENISVYDVINIGGKPVEIKKF